MILSFAIFSMILAIDTPLIANAQHPPRDGSLFHPSPPPPKIPPPTKSPTNRPTSSSPVYHIDGKPITFPSDYRSIDGTVTTRRGNLLLKGSASIRLTRGDEGILYEEDGSSIKTTTKSGSQRPNPRAISNAFDQTSSIPAASGASDWLWQWGQFIDHDFVEVDAQDPEIDMSIEIPENDPYFSIESLSLTRSHFELDEIGTAQQVNEISSFIDANTVYSNSGARLTELLDPDAFEKNGSAVLGTGRLKVSSDHGTQLLPYNINGFKNAGGDENTDFFLAGDIRVNEQLNLIVIHTLWVREHNYWADKIRRENPDLGGLEVFEMARIIVQSEIQKITFDEFLPVLLGENTIPPYNGFDPNIDPSAMNLGATCAYRVGHTLLSPVLQRIYDDGVSMPVNIGDGFFSPQYINESGLNPFLRGLSSQVCQESDPFITHDIRNNLFGTEDDLLARNIQRGRDHGIPNLNRIRENILGEGERHEGFDSPLFQRGMGSILENVYEKVGDIDCFIGLVSEVHEPGAMVGRTLQKILKKQFQYTRDGDRFFYKHMLRDHGALLEMIEKTKLSDVIKRNADKPHTLDDIQENVFLAKSN